MTVNRELFQSLDFTIMTYTEEGKAAGSGPRTVIKAKTQDDP